MVTTSNRIWQRCQIPKCRQIISCTMRYSLAPHRSHIHPSGPEITASISQRTGEGICCVIDITPPIILDLISAATCHRRPDTETVRCGRATAGRFTTRTGRERNVRSRVSEGQGGILAIQDTDRRVGRALASHQLHGTVSQWAAKARPIYPGARDPFERV